MTNATNPTLINVSVLGGNVRTYVDNRPSFKRLSSKTLTALTTTGYGAFTNKYTGSTYQVPASTNCQIFGFESLEDADNASSLWQFGYSDDGAGANFVSLFDSIAAFGNGTGVTKTNIIFPCTIPASKYPTIKVTTTQSFTYTAGWMEFFILETN